MNENYLGDNLRKIRKLYERKQVDIAHCIGLSVRQYRKMENNEIPIKDKYLLKLADCYSITIQTLREFNATRIISVSENTEYQLFTSPSVKTQKNQLLLPMRNSVLLPTMRSY